LSTWYYARYGRLATSAEGQKEELDARSEIRVAAFRSCWLSIGIAAVNAWINVTQPKLVIDRPTVRTKKCTTLVP
jgi:hypothetical protein